MKTSLFKCIDALLPDGDVCPKCGGRRAPSGVDGGSWVHVSDRSDRVISTEIQNGFMTVRLANGVVIRYKKKVVC